MAVLDWFGKEIAEERAKEQKNVDLINSTINEYSKAKEEIYALICELMGQIAFIGEEAAKVIEDHQIVPKDIHKKYRDKIVVLINAIEADVSIECEEKVVARNDSRGSSRNSSPASNANHGRFTNIS